MRQCRLSFLALLAAAFVVCDAASGDQGSSRSCRLPSGAELQLRTPRVVIWHRDTGEETFGAYACSKSDGRRRLLKTGEDGSYGEDRFGDYYVNGKFVAFSYLYLSHYGYGGLSVEVARLRERSSVEHRLVADVGMYTPHVKVTDLVVSKRGRPAYIVLTENPAYPLPDQFRYDLPLSEVRDSRGRVLDTGPVSSLRPNSDRVTWLHDGERRSAPFG